MSSEDVKVQISGGVGFSGLLFITFLVLKLTNVITWSWWWVTAPLWVPWAIVLGILVVVFLVAVCVHIYNEFF